MELIQPFYEVDRLEQMLTGIAKVTSGGKLSLDNMSELAEFHKHDVATMLELVGNLRDLITELVEQSNPEHQEREMYWKKMQELKTLKEAAI